MSQQLRLPEAWRNQHATTDAKPAKRRVYRKCAGGCGGYCFTPKAFYCKPCRYERDVALIRASEKKRRRKSRPYEPSRDTIVAKLIAEGQL